MEKESKKVQASKGKQTREEETATTAIVKIDNTPMTVIATKSEENREEKIKKLEEEIFKLHAKLSQEPKDFEEKIRYYQEKQEKIEQLAGLVAYESKLKTHSETLKKLEEEDDFKCDKYSLTFDYKENYRSTPALAINNPVLIGEVIEFLLCKISEKKEALKLVIAQ